MTIAATILATTALAPAAGTTPGGVAAPAGGDATLAFAALLLAGVTGKPADKADDRAGERQDNAVDGKALPDGDQPDSDDASAVGALLSWFPLPAPLPTPTTQVAAPALDAATKPVVAASLAPPGTLPLATAPSLPDATVTTMPSSPSATPPPANDGPIVPTPASAAPNIVATPVPSPAAPTPSQPLRAPSTDGLQVSVADIPRPSASATASSPVVSSSTQPPQSVPVAVDMVISPKAGLATGRSDASPHTPVRITMPTSAAVPAVASPTPPVTSEAPAAAAAAQVFAAAIHRLAATADSGTDASGTPIAAGLASAAPDQITTTAVATPGANDAALDMGARRWPEAMIARIEHLRSAHDAIAAEGEMTRATTATLKLAPDALGSVEVSLHRHEDRVQVQIVAEQPRAQALIADAQPRLNELAEARGIRLQHLSSGIGSNAQQGGGGEQRTATTPSRTNRTFTTTSDSDDADHRIA